MNRIFRTVTETSIVFIGALFALTLVFASSQTWAGADEEPTDSDRVKLRELLNGREPNDVDTRTIGKAKQKLHADELRERKNTAQKARKMSHQKPPEVLMPEMAELDIATPAELPSGIMEGVEGPWSSSVFKTENAWQGSIDGYAVGVYAGSKPGNKKWGVLMVIAEPDTNNLQPYSTPTATGPVRILSESGGVLVIRSKQRMEYLFDLRQRIFLP